MKNPLLSARIRTAVREELVGWTLGTIGDLFEAEGFVAALDHSPRVSGERRAYVEQFYAGIDWTNWDQVRRVLRVIEAVLDRMRATEQTETYGASIAQNRAALETLLRRDGFEFDELGAIRPQWEVLTQQSLLDLPDESAIPGHIRRMWEAVESRPEQSISAAKDAIESAARHALAVLGVETPPKPKFPALVDLVQRSLKLHPATVAPDAKGAESIVGMLGSLATIANKIDEFRNLYGDGHGRPAKVAGLTPRHSRFVARCADAYVGMLLDTLDAPGAPWRRHAQGAQGVTVAGEGSTSRTR